MAWFFYGLGLRGRYGYLHTQKTLRPVHPRNPPSHAQPRTLGMLHGDLLKRWYENPSVAQSLLRFSDNCAVKFKEIDPKVAGSS